MTLLRVALLALALTACAIVPGTDRYQLLLLSESEAATLGAESFTAMTAESTIVSSGANAQMVQRIGKRIVAAAERLYPARAAGQAWEFVLIKEDVANAWALPGGKSAVYTGLLPVTQDEASLAVVMGHEVAHVIAQHGNERISTQVLAEQGLAAADLLSKDSDYQGEIMTALGLTTQFGVLKYSRTHESEADHLGLMLAADAGYDPTVAPGLWERMASLGGSKPPEWLSTHPSEETRIKRLKELMPEAKKLYEKAKAAGR